MKNVLCCLAVSIKWIGRSLFATLVVVAGYVSVVKTWEKFESVNQLSDLRDVAIGVGVLLGIVAICGAYAWAVGYSCEKR